MQDLAPSISGEDRLKSRTTLQWEANILAGNVYFLLQFENNFLLAFFNAECPPPRQFALVQNVPPRHSALVQIVPVSVKCLPIDG